jgi:hypothetical protein
MAAARRSAATPAQGYLRLLVAVKSHGFLEDPRGDVRDHVRAAASFSWTL